MVVTVHHKSPSRTTCWTWKTPTCTVELISAAKPPVTGASWLMSKRPVFATDWRKKKKKEKKHNYRRFKVGMASLKTKTMFTNITTGEAAVRRCCLQSTKLQLNFVCSGGSLWPVESDFLQGLTNIASLSGIFWKLVYCSTIHLCAFSTKIANSMELNFIWLVSG